MKYVSSTLIAASLVLSAPQIAQACMSKPPLTQQEIAFADVIFEGRITDISSGPVNSFFERPLFYKFTFDVGEVVRGELSSNEIVVGWMPQNLTGEGKLSLKEYKDFFGETTRVAISTPKLANLFCESKSSRANIIDGEVGELVTEEVVQAECKSPVASLVPAIEENIPFVLSNGYYCGSTYIYPAEAYNKMLDYEENLKKFERLKVQSREIYGEIVGEGGPLPWATTSLHPDGIAARLFREQAGYFQPSLRTNDAWQASLLDFGEAMVRDTHLGYTIDLEKGGDAHQKFREALRNEILALLGYSEKDPDFRARFLLED